jgi:hypothetical protein
MYKVLSLILLCFISFSLQQSLLNVHQYTQESRDFLTGLMSIIQGKEYHVDDQCLGSDFEKDMDTLIDAVKNENTLLVAAIAGKIMSKIEEKCPKSDLTKVYNDTQTLCNNKEIMNRMIKHSQDVVHILKGELNVSQMTPRNIGETVGKLINILIYDKKENSPSLNLNFLGIDEELTADQIQEQGQNIYSRESVELFVTGFFEGVSSVPVDKNQCMHDIGSAKSELVTAFADLINALKTRTQIIEALMNFYQLTLHLKGMDANCKFTTLSEDLMALTTKVGMTKLAFRVTTHMMAVIEDLRSTVINVESKDFQKAGVSFGAVTKIALNYSTI